jgi:hypothetical protein
VRAAWWKARRGKRGVEKCGVRGALSFGRTQFDADLGTARSRLAGGKTRHDTRRARYHRGLQDRRARGFFCKQNHGTLAQFWRVPQRGLEHKIGKDDGGKHGGSSLRATPNTQHPTSNIQ